MCIHARKALPYHVPLACCCCGSNIVGRSERTLVPQRSNRTPRPASTSPLPHFSAMPLPLPSITGASLRVLGCRASICSCSAAALGHRQRHFLHRHSHWHAAATRTATAVPPCFPWAFHQKGAEGLRLCPAEDVVARIGSRCRLALALLVLVPAMAAVSVSASVRRRQVSVGLVRPNHMSLARRIPSGIPIGHSGGCEHIIAHTRVSAATVWIRSWSTQLAAGGGRGRRGLVHPTWPVWPGLISRLKTRLKLA